MEFFLWPQELPRGDLSIDFHVIWCLSRNGRCSKAKVVSLSNRSKPWWNLKLSKEIPDRLALKWVFRCTNDTSIRIRNIPWSKAPSGPSTYQDFGPPKKTARVSLVPICFYVGNLMPTHASNFPGKNQHHQHLPGINPESYAKCLIKKRVATRAARVKTAWSETWCSTTRRPTRSRNALKAAIEEENC